MTGTAVGAPVAPAPPKHGILDDVLGLLVGTIVVSLGLTLLKAAAVVTGGTAGLALLVSYALPVPFALLFVVINLPFFLLAIRRRGWNFTIRSLIAIALVSGLSSVHAAFLPAAQVEPIYAAIVGNTLCGVGILILFRHRSSLGGFSIVALIMQDRFGLRAGYVLMCFDAVIVLASFAVVTPLNVAISAVGVVVVNLILALNHRPGRYLGT